MDKKKLAKVAQKKREELIREFYNKHKEEIIASAEKGYTGLNIEFSTIDEPTRVALRVERARLSEIVKEVDLELITARLILTDMKYISKASFKW